MRTCITCKQELGCEHFYRYRYKCGMRFDSRCKECARARRKARHDRCPERGNIQSKLWRERNKEAVEAYAKQYRSSAHGKRMKAVAQNARYAKMKAVSFSEDQAAILAIYHQAKEIERGLADCINTDDPLSIKMHVDHIIPLSAGGAHSPENLRIISARENLEKGARVE